MKSHVNTINNNHMSKKTKKKKKEEKFVRFEISTSTEGKALRIDRELEASGVNVFELIGIIRVACEQEIDRILSEAKNDDDSGDGI